MMIQLAVTLGAALAFAPGCATGAASIRGADDARFASPDEVSTPVSLGYRLGLSVGNGLPANDIPVPAGLFGRYELNERWAVGLGVDLSEGELEDPAQRLGLTPLPGADDMEGLLSYTHVGVWVERTLWRRGVHSGYGLAGLGAAFVDVDGVSGALQGGGTFDIVDNNEVEAVGTVGLGYRLRFGTHWDFDVLGRYEYHVADWELTDRVSGATSNVGDYSLGTLLFGIAFHF